MRHVKVIEGQEATLPQLKAEFGLQKTEDAHFFQEWEGELPALNDIEKKTLEDLRGDYLHLSTYPILEPIVTLVVLSPLLRMAGFYRSPFQLVEQQEIRIAAEDEDGKLSRGRVDILRFQPQFWTAAIESTTIQYSLDVGISQTLLFMVKDAVLDRPIFSFVTNGIAFKFFKLLRSELPIYGESQLFSIDRSIDLYRVVQILKFLGKTIQVQA